MTACSPHIRRATERDLRGILRIERASFASDAWGLPEFRHYLQYCDDLFLIATVAGRVAGYGITCFERGVAELDSIAVHPDFRGTGVAVALLRRTATILRRRRIRTWRLLVRRSNRDAIALYRGFGFRRTRTVPAYYPDGEDAWRMQFDSLAARNALTLN